MGQYIVSIDNEEASAAANAISMTGRVNKTPVAAKVRISDMTPLNQPDQKKAKQKALINAYEAAIQEQPESDGEAVEA